MERLSWLQLIIENKLLIFQKDNRRQSKVGMEIDLENVNVIHVIMNTITSEIENCFNNHLPLLDLELKIINLKNLSVEKSRDIINKVYGLFSSVDKTLFKINYKLDHCKETLTFFIQIGKL